MVTTLIILDDSSSTPVNKVKKLGDEPPPLPLPLQVQTDQTELMEEQQQGTTAAWTGQEMSDMEGTARRQQAISR